MRNLGNGTTRLLAAFLLLASAGCGSLSDSSASISKSISSPFTSSSASSSPEEAYETDVCDYTAAHVKSGGTGDALNREIGKIAEKHGISDWEVNEATYRAVGAGLAKAGMRQVEMDAFKSNFAQTLERAKWLQKGYDAAR